MFTFSSPWFLIFLAIIPAAAVFRSRKRVHPSLAVSAIGAVKSLKRSWILDFRRVLVFFKYASFALIVIAMARPQWGTEQMNILTEGINIILAVDISESMGAMDFKRGGKAANRLEAVKGVVDEFISKRTGDRIGLVVFGSYAYTQLPLTRDYGTISYVLERMEIGAAGRKTAIGDAIGISLKRITDVESKSNIVILLTDGRSNSGELSPETAAEIASQKKVKIYTVAVGQKGRAPFLVNDPIMGARYVYQRVDVDEEILKHIAQKTGGRFFQAGDTKGLEKIYETIDQLEKTEVKVKVFANYRELYPYFLLPAFLLLVLWAILVNTRFLRVP